MGVLEDLASKRRQVLATRTLIGRSPACRMRVDASHVSKEHAMLWFDEGAWWLRDLGSRNGTWVDGQRVEAMASQRLEAGARLAFGGESEVWVLSQADAPGPMAERLRDDTLVCGTADFLMLPDADDPLAAVFADRGAWMVEVEGVSRAAVDQEVLQLDGQLFRLALPIDGATTMQHAAPSASASASSSTPLLRLRVSQDQEYVQVEVRREADAGVDVLPPKVHHQLLLTLARVRLDDAEASEVERGWVYTDELCTMLRIDRRTVNQYVFRARRELTARGPGLAAKVVERRTTTDQIRLGIAEVEIGSFES